MTDVRLTPGSRLRLAPEVLLREEDGGFLLYDIRKDQLYRGNQTGMKILALCDGHRTLGEITGHFTAVSGLPGEEITGYIGTFLEDMLRKGLVEPT